LYASAPVDFSSYSNIVLPCDGASDSLTFLGTIVLRKALKNSAYIFDYT
jgi:hypothetical protein